MQLAIKDIWLALHITRWWFGTCALITVLTAFAVWLGLWVLLASQPSMVEASPAGNGRSVGVGTVTFGITLVVGAAGLVLTLVTSILVFINYNRGIVLHAGQGTVSWPASDIENSLIDIITFKRFRKHLRREVVPLNQIIDIRNDTIGRSSDDRYRLNVSGHFGSRQLEFSNKQKRDECRMRLIAKLKELGRGASRDANYDNDSGGSS